MTLDAYSNCPSGNGQKIKFCDCGKDIVPHLERITRALEGGQRHAALQHAKRSLEQKGDRPCLLALKVEACFELEDIAGAAETARRFHEVAPNNVLAMAHNVLCLAAEDDLEAAIDMLQLALAQGQRTIPRRLYDAIAEVPPLALRHGAVLAAVGHATVQRQYESDDSPAQELLERLWGAREVSPLLKFVPALRLPAASDHPLRARLERCDRMSLAGLYRAARAELQTMLAESPDEALLHYNLGLVNALLADFEDAAAHWRRYSSAPGVALEDAVEAAALASLHSDETDTLPIRQVTFDVLDFDRVGEVLLSERRFVSIPPPRSEDPNVPAPRAACFMMDASLPREPAPGDENPRRVLMRLYLFGKETDRPARLEAVTAPGVDPTAPSNDIREMMGRFLGPAGLPLVVEDVPYDVSVFSALNFFPSNVSPEEQGRRNQALSVQCLYNEWVNHPRKELDGKTPREAAADPALQIRVLARVLLMEDAHRLLQVDWNDFRRRLGLPERAPRVMTADEVMRASSARLDLLDVAATEDDTLLVALAQADMLSNRSLVCPLAREILKRPQILEKHKDLLLGLYQRVAMYSTDYEEAKRCFELGRAWLVKHGHSPAQWMVLELNRSLVENDRPAAEALINKLKRDHGAERETMRHLQALLERHAALAGQFSPRAPLPQQASAGESVANQPAATETAPPKKIWLPGDSSEGGETKKLWTPGG